MQVRPKGHVVVMGEPAAGRSDLIEALARVKGGGNKLTGPIPPQLGDLANLTYLNLSWNLLSGPIPVQLTHLTNLTTLHLSLNNLTGCVPQALHDIEQNDMEHVELPVCG